VRRPKPVVLVILDGWGLGPDLNGNAVRRARTPNLDSWIASYPHGTLQCSGRSVGLTEGQMGDSNVGHLNLGAGRVVYQDLARIQEAVAAGELQRNPVLVETVRRAKAGGQTLHLAGLLSGGGVHSHLDHLLALLEVAAGAGIGNVVVHAFLDGRDEPPTSARAFVTTLLQALTRTMGAGRIGTISGRYYAMDRDRRWERTAKAYRVMVAGEGRRAASALEAIAEAYARGETDEFVEPTLIASAVSAAAASEAAPLVRSGDSLIFFNFRPDRARQLARAFIFRDFDAFARPGGFVENLSVVTLTEYDRTFPVPVVFPPVEVTGVLGEVIARAGLTQLRIAETEKYAHVTYFFSGGQETPFPGEERVLIPSPKVSTYDAKPEMSAPEVAAEACRRIEEGRYDFIVLNFANADMVGHTGDFHAAVRAVEAVDRAAGRVVRAVLERGGLAVVVSDHGNAEQTIDTETGQAHTAHTAYPAPIVIAGPESLVGPARVLRPGILADVAPTLLSLMGLEKPPQMTGRSLL
jgi:2,3-bisphosphoglycerate-independent phosphoglycerate mutase